MRGRMTEREIEKKARMRWEEGDLHRAIQALRLKQEAGETTEAALFHRQRLKATMGVMRTGLSYTEPHTELKQTHA